MKPGKPLLVARRGEQWILGLPGNPVSSYVTAFLFLLPLLRAAGGRERAAARALIRAHRARRCPPAATGSSSSAPGWRAARSLRSAEQDSERAARAGRAPTR